MILENDLKDLTPTELAKVLDFLKGNGQVFIPFYWTQDDVADKVESNEGIEDIIHDLNEGDYDSSDFDSIFE